MSEGPLYVSPSKLARFFFLECERFLRYSATPSAQRPSQGVPEKVERPSVVTEAILEGGYEWEEQVLKGLGDQAIVGQPTGGSELLRDRVLPCQDLLSQLRDPKSGTFLYQAHVSPPAAFYKRFGIDPAEITFSDCRPDLLKVARADDGSFRLWVIDVKATDAVKFSHRAQCAFYALLLSSIIEEEGITGITVELDSCGIWLFGRDEPEVCDLRPLMGPVQEFIRVELPRILLQPADQARWSLFFPCEWCDFFEHCRTQAEAENDVSLLPYFAPEAKRFLESLDPPVRSLPVLDKFLAEPEAAERLRASATLGGRHERLQQQVQALQSDRALSTGSSIALPRGQKVGVVISLHKDPITGGVFAAGVQVRAGNEVCELRGTWTQVASEPSPEGLTEVRRGLVDQLEHIFTTVDSYNADKPWREQLSLQCYCYDGFERGLLDQIFLEALRDADTDLAERALALLFHFQSEHLARSDRHPGTPVPFPLVVATKVLRRTAALPVPVAFKLSAVSEAVQPEQYATVYNEDPRFTFPLSNRIRSDVMFKAWNGEDAAEVEAATAEVASELERRMKACFSILSGLIELKGNELFAYAPKFRLPQRDQFSAATLSKLAFVARYETLLRYLEARGARAKPRSERLESGIGLRVRLVQLLKDNRKPVWRAELAPESSHITLEASSFSNWLLSEDSQTGDREQMRFVDWGYRDKWYAPKGIGIHYAAITSVEPDRSSLELTITLGKDAPAPQADLHYLLHPRFTDWNTKKVLEALNLLDGMRPCPYVQLLEEPQERLRLPLEADADRVEALIAALGFTESQEAALRRILHNRLQLVWGPPGTGKTHFLGLLVCTMAALARDRGEEFSVLISGFTHSAIENCLRKIHELAGLHQEHLPRLDIFKLGEWKGQDKPAGLIEAASDPRETSNPPELSVVGATVYSIHKHLDFAFDLVILDEGSQLKVPEAAIPASRLHSESRFVIAGDDKQLGPIMAGRYPEPEPYKPWLYTSIFECLRLPDEQDNLYTSQLLECFRLNDTLCRFPADTLYGLGYKPFSAAVSKQRITLSEPSQDTPDWLEFALDPDYPLVLLVLRGVPALAENVVEAGLVSEAVNELRDRLQSDEKPYEDDAHFWREGLFVVSPHRVQIRAICDQLEQARDWTAPPFVDTVDKMQGRESQAVIVSYGVGSTDYALQEGEFIYSRRRLNVSITRAKAKALVFLPEALLTPPVTAFGRDDIIEGLDYMLRLQRFCVENGEEREFPVTKGSGATLRAIRATC